MPYRVLAGADVLVPRTGQASAPQVRPVSTAPRPPLDGADHTDLARKLDFLRKAGSYPERARAVEVLETHFSFVFLTERHAYKLKKPVRLAYLDYSSIDLRRRHCEQEVRLNRRLAPDDYFGVVPLLSSTGSFSLGPLDPLSEQKAWPEGAIAPATADWLVVMRRLPREQMLEQLIAREAVRSEEIRRVVDLLGRFYSRAERAGWSGSEYVTRLEHAVLRYRDELGATRFELDGARLDAVTRAQLGLVRGAREVFMARAVKVVDGHGDLRPEHVYLGVAPRVLDCIEFDRELRWLDPASELSFLALECERLGAAPVGQLVLESYVELSGDVLSKKLLDFYRSHHAMVRATLALWHLDDPAVNERSKWVQKAHAYIAIAARALRVADDPIGELAR